MLKAESREVGSYDKAEQLFGTAFSESLAFTHLGEVTKIKSGGGENKMAIKKISATTFSCYNLQ